jgi:hypothetical protein
MIPTDIVRATAALIQTVPPHDIPVIFTMLATSRLLGRGLLAATRPGSTKAQAFRSLLVTFATVVCLIVTIVVLRCVDRI